MLQSECVSHFLISWAYLVTELIADSYMKDPSPRHWTFLEVEVYHSSQIELDHTFTTFICSSFNATATSNAMRRSLGWSRNLGDELKECLRDLWHWLDFLKSPKQRLIRGLTYSTLKFMRSSCGNSSFVGLIFDL